MEPAEAAQAPQGRKRFTVQPQDPESTTIRPLFKSSCSATEPRAPAPLGAASYAEYIVTKVPMPDPRPASLGSGEGAASGMLPPGNEASTAPCSTSGSRDSDPSPTLKSGAKSNCIIVSPRQCGNPILKFVRNVPWEFGEIVPDYVLGQSTCALFLSLRYHNLHPNYIHERLRLLGKMYALQVLLLQKDPHQALKELAKMCILADCTLILAWSPEEAGRYLETYKAYEQKPADLLKEKVDQDFLSKMTDCLTSVKSVNKTDTLSLLSTFGSLANIARASKEELSLCPGIGPQKAKRLFDTLHQPFLKIPK
ncbi:DNA excision repair protein ERCC-1 isoform X2 [Emydura macquarii macquarii]|uniref:DNA excision repair protein ERCC-1 isoform X2 n=1 Tax=Emydura macquarii macquarii TaxID=1129001 RepID=UPI00352BC0C6